MPKSSSPWDFSGELFPVETLRRVRTVTELTSEVRRALEQQIGQVWVGGEITNFRQQSSGRIYFTLKDAGAQLSCVLFRGDAVAQRGDLADGRKVILKGDITVYEARGQYQLQVQAVELQGEGALQAAFARLKRKLEAEGLFAPERKRPLPRFPQRIGLVTSPTGAAIRDVLHVLGRRNPTVEIILAPCAVQGAGAAAEIAAAIGSLNRWSATREPLDVILVTRGGGSLEDLWAFNEELVARAIFNSQLPVVSAVGHEIDFTISDFVADVRAATPSAAAEILSEDFLAGRRWLEKVPEQMAEVVRNRWRAELRHFDQLARRLRAAHPRRQLNSARQQVDEWQASLARSVRHQWEALENAWQIQRARLSAVRPGRALARRREHLERLRSRLQGPLAVHLDRKRRQSEALAARLRLLGPEQVLARGYSITTDADSGKIIRSANETAPGKKIRTRLATDHISSTVNPAD